jgi:hypothetical protein
MREMISVFQDALKKNSARIDCCDAVARTTRDSL